MSSSRTAATKVDRQPTPTAPTRAIPAPAMSADVIKVAAAIERALANGDRDALSNEALQALMAAGCKAYAARIEAGHDQLPFGQSSGVSPTDVMVTASGLLRAVNLAVFELGMWQSWTGR
jgi:hypothetical protein